jgi:TraM recognition site of TraD and TraG
MERAVRWVNRHRSVVAATVGAALGLYGAVLLVGVLHRATGWPELVAASRAAARYVWFATVIQVPITGAMVAAGVIQFLEVRQVLPPPPRDWKPLPPYPFDANKTQLVLGEEHDEDGGRSEAPRWRALPESGMATGILVLGATGAAKTSAAQYPYTAQLIRLHAKNPQKKLGGLIVDAKGNYAEFVRQQCVQAGRLDDYYEISLESGVKYNVISRPDLGAPALGGHIGDMIANVQGEAGAEGPFWRTEAKDLATQVIRIVRLAKRREPTMLDLYRLATSETLFRDWIAAAQAAVDGGQGDPTELRSIQFWLEHKQSKLKDELRAAIAAGLNGTCSLFDTPGVRETFCPAPEEENFLGFDDLIAEGKIVALRVPYSHLKTVSQVVGTMTKLNFFDAVLNRLAKVEAGQATDVGRMVFFVADEYDGYITQTGTSGDGNFLAKCREAKCCTIVATQSLASFIAKLKNEHVANQIVANLRTKIWLCAEDNYTATQASGLCGQVERQKVSRSVSESANGGSGYSYVDGKFLAGGDVSLGESTSVQLTREAMFDPREFTMLRLNQSIAKIFDGRQVLSPRYLYLKPYYGNPNESWFDETARIEKELADA